MNAWAARYHTWLLITLMPKGVVFAFSFLQISAMLSKEPHADAVLTLQYVHAYLRYTNG